MDNEVVQTGEVSKAAPEGTSSTPATTQTAQPDLASMKAQLEALTKQIGELKLTSTKEIQSAKDKAIAEVKKAKLAEEALSQISSKVRGVSPELYKDVELEVLRAKAKRAEAMETESDQAQQQAEFHKQFRANIEEALTEMGLDVKHPQLDWADDAPNYIEAQKRILKSAAKIKKEQETVSKTSAQEELKKQLKEAENKLRKELGLDSVDTSISSGSSSDNTSLVAKVASGQPLTKDERARAKKILGI